MATIHEVRMVSRDEYARILESFFMEMAGGGSMAYDESALRRLPGFATELDEHIALVRDPATRPEAVLQMAFGLVDEFVRATWEHTVTESYALYRDMSGDRSGVSPAQEPDE